MSLAQYVQLAFDLLRNAALIVLGSLGYCVVRRWVEDRVPGWVQSLLYGTIFGLIAVVSMAAAVSFPDTPRVSLSVAAYILATAFVGIEAGVVTASLDMLV